MWTEVTKKKSPRKEHPSLKSSLRELFKDYCLFDLQKKCKNEEKCEHTHLDILPISRYISDILKNPILLDGIQSKKSDIVSFLKENTEIGKSNINNIYLRTCVYYLINGRCSSQKEDRIVNMDIKFRDTIIPISICYPDPKKAPSHGITCAIHYDFDFNFEYNRMNIIDLLSPITTNKGMDDAIAQVIENSLTNDISNNTKQEIPVKNDFPSLPLKKINNKFMRETIDFNKISSKNENIIDKFLVKEKTEKKKKPHKITHLDTNYTSPRNSIDINQTFELPNIENNDIDNIMDLNELKTLFKRYLELHKECVINNDELKRRNAEINYMYGVVLDIKPLTNSRLSRKNSLIDKEQPSTYDEDFYKETEVIEENNVYYEEYEYEYEDY